MFRVSPPDSQLATLQSAEDLEESVNINEAFETSVAVGAHSFARMEVDVDRRRQQRLQRDTHIDVLNREQYKRLAYSKLPVMVKRLPYIKPAIISKRVAYLKLLVI